MGLSRGAWVVAGIGAAAVATGSAFAGTQYAGRASVETVEPAPNAAVATTRPLMSFTTAKAGRLTKLKVLLDGKDVTRSVGRTAGKLVIASPALAQGRHTVDVTVATRNIFSHTLRRKWSFTVDTKQPPLALTAPKGTAVAKRAVGFAGSSEPGARVTLGWKNGTRTGTTATTAGADGVWRLSAQLPEGAANLKLRAADGAGNVTIASRALTVDTVAPKLVSAKLPPMLTTDDPLIEGQISGDSADNTVIGAKVNGKEIIPARVGTVGSGAPTLSLTGNKFSMSVGAIPQGKNTVQVFVRDAAGNTSTVQSEVLVDSTEDFGSKDMLPGARGADVKKFQEALKQRGFKKIKLTGVYDPQTTRTVMRYQKVHKIRPSGVFGTRTREAFIGKIVVTLSKFRLQLIRDGKVIVTYPVAVGQPAFPTPTGSYFVVNKQSDPTWTPPPDSSWAKGLGPIPPGPGNPLGTRWIGTSAPYVGIHGTNAPSSIGTRASHGCIRMKIPDVEALYEQVAVGMPVELRA